MNPVEIIIVAALIIAVAAVIIYMIRKKRRGEGCSCNCESCAFRCEKKEK